MNTSPGLLDLQVNGYAGVDFNDPRITATDPDHALSAMRKSGVTQCLPTLITAWPEQLRERFRALDAAVAASRLGIGLPQQMHKLDNALLAQLSEKGLADYQWSPHVARRDCGARLY